MKYNRLNHLPLLSGMMLQDFSILQVLVWPPAASLPELVSWLGSISLPPQPWSIPLHLEIC